MISIFMTIKKFILSDERIVQDSYFWNMLSNLLSAFQSVLILIVLTRVLTLEESGIFTIATANAIFFLVIGRYGVRNYQVSDVKNGASFSNYCRTRWITVAAMGLVSVVYVVRFLLTGDYTLSKALVVLLMCIYKMPDAIEDVYYGEYQRRGRLDIAAKCMTIRLLLAIISLILFVVITKNLIMSLVLANALSFLALCILIRWTAPEFDLTGAGDFAEVKLILTQCFPLFLAGFLSQYINNAPKYAIDASLSDEVQACYGFIAMPVFVIGLFSSMVFNPIIHKMAEFWNNGNRRLFLGYFLRQTVVIIGLSIAAIIGGGFLGIPVLSILYNTDLTDYKMPLIILLVGGGFLAETSLISVILTIMRQQFKLLIGYILVALIAFGATGPVVRLYGLSGATWMYTGLMVVLTVVFLLIFMWEYNKG